MTWETTTEHQNEKRKSSMLQPKIQPSDGLSFRTCTVFIFMVLQSVGEPSQLICSHQPIVALAGDDVILPCHLEPPINVSSETVIWTRTDLDPKYIHFYEDGRTVYWDQNPSYHYRTRLFEGKLMNGNVSMKIFRVKLSDAGKYFCILDSMMKDASIQLTVGAVSTPVIEFVSNQSREVVLQCEAKGWYPDPELFWLDGEGNLLSAGPTETVRGPDDLYTVSRRLTVRKSDSFTCRVQQKNIKQTRETHVYVPEDFFMVKFSLGQTEFIFLIIIFIFYCLCILALVVSVKNFSYERNNGEHHVKQVMLNIQESPKVKKRDAKEAAHELRPMLKRKKQQEEQQEQQEEQREQLEGQREQPEGQREQPEEQREQPEEQREQPEEQREQLEEQREQPEGQREQPEEQREQPEEQREQLEEEREQREQLEEEQEQLEEEQEQLEEQREQLEEQREQLEVDLD